VPIDDWTETDADGVLRAQVPDERTYRIEILDDSVEAPPPDQHVDDGLAVLLCHFVDGEGAPLADEPVEVKSGEETMALRTDAEGRIDSPAHLGGYELKVREHNFTAHAIPLADRAKEETLYRFVVGEPRDVHLIAVEVRSLGGTLLADHRVRVLDPETGEPVGDWLKTDASGVLRTQVPDDRTYRIEIADEETQPAAQPEHHVDQPPAVLFCHFVDGSGTPIANERVQATRGGDTFELFTDEEGRIDDPAQLGDYQLKIKGRAFTAHGLPLADRESSEGYRFVIEESKG
jgi:hypothetical protein